MNTYIPARGGCGCWCVCVGGGALPLWESVGMRRGFAPIFSIWTLDDLFAPQPKFDVYHFIQILLGLISKAPHFQYIDDLIVPQIE